MGNQFCLGASIVDSQGNEHWDTSQDKVIEIGPGSKVYTRYLSLPLNVAQGSAEVIGQVWFGEVSNTDSSIQICRHDTNVIEINA